MYDLTGYARKGEFDLTCARELCYEKKMKILMKILMPTIEVLVYSPGRFLPYLQATKKSRQALVSPVLA